MGLAAALISCALYAMLGVENGQLERLELQAAASPLTPRTSVLVVPPALAAPSAIVGPAPLPALVPLLEGHTDAASTQVEPASLSAKVRTHPPRRQPTPACISGTDLNAAQQQALLGIFSRSHTRLYPKERLVLVKQESSLQIESAPKSMSRRVRAQLQDELERSSESFRTLDHDTSSTQIEIRCPLEATE